MNTIKILPLSILLSFVIACTKTTSPVPEISVSTDPNIGCTDPLAKNYKATAKEEDCGCQYDYTSAVSTKIPSNFTQNILVEQHTGTWCGYCPMGKEAMSEAIKSPRVVGLEIHYDDEMANMDKIYTPLKNKFGHPAFPTGMVNRKKSIIGSTILMGADKRTINGARTTEWQANIDAYLKTEKSSYGIALESKLTGNDLQVMTHVNFQLSTADKYGLGVYLVENDVTGYPQLNYLSNYNIFQEYASYKLPSEIQDIKHHNVARDAIAAIDNGIEIPLAATNYSKTYHKLFKITLPSSVKNAANCKIIAFIVNRKTNEIINVQQADINKVVSWQ